MSRCLRYQQPKIYAHIASQYVLGVMTSRVRTRTEKLMATTPELERAVANWADEFAVLHAQLPAVELTIKKRHQIWRAIDQATMSEKKTSSSIWVNIFSWKAATGFSAAASLMLAFMLWFSVPTTLIVATGPSYLATMSAYHDAEKEIQFVISVYGKSIDTPSRLHLQWSQANVTKHPPALHLWAEDKDTLKLSYIGLQPPRDEHWTLTKLKWDAIANSRRLLMTEDKQLPNDKNTLFAGICLQLKKWQSG